MLEGGVCPCGLQTASPQTREHRRASVSFGLSCRSRCRGVSPAGAAFPLSSARSAGAQLPLLSDQPHGATLIAAGRRSSDDTRDPNQLLLPQFCFTRVVSSVQLNFSSPRCTHLSCSVAIQEFHNCSPRSFISSSSLTCRNPPLREQRENTVGTVLSLVLIFTFNAAILYVSLGAGSSGSHERTAA